MKVRGHNPMTLLYQALSDGLHAKTDGECLESAHDIRVVLFEFADRLGQALKDDAELVASIGRLMKKEKKKGATQVEDDDAPEPVDPNEVTT